MPTEFLYPKYSVSVLGDSFSFTDEAIKLRERNGNILNMSLRIRVPQIKFPLCGSGGALCPAAHILVQGFLGFHSEEFSVSGDDLPCVRKCLG